MTPWVPRHSRAGPSPLIALVVLHQTGARHVQVPLWIAAVGSYLRNKLRNKCLLHPNFVKYGQPLHQLPSLPSLISNTSAPYLEMDESAQERQFVMQELGFGIDNVSAQACRAQEAFRAEPGLACAISELSNHNWFAVIE